MSWAEEVLARREVWGRAPSAHNTQPWVVTVEAGGAGESSLTVGWDEARHLVQGDATRRDLMPPDIADELAKLQDKVPPFPAELALVRKPAAAVMWVELALFIRFQAIS